GGRRAVSRRAGRLPARPGHHDPDPPGQGTDPGGPGVRVLPLLPAPPPRPPHHPAPLRVRGRPLRRRPAAPGRPRPPPRARGAGRPQLGGVPRPGRDRPGEDPMSRTEIPGYTYGTDAVPRSPVSLQELELLQATLLLGPDD